MSDINQPPSSPGWFPDRNNPGIQRYWDGTGWTENVAPLNQPAAPAVGLARPSSQRKLSSIAVVALIIAIL